MMFCEDASDTLKMADFNTPPDMAIADENVIGRYEAHTTRGVSSI